MTESSPQGEGSNHAASPHAHLAHHFDTPGQQYDSARLGMWIFLVTEILFFGGLFCVYAVYRANRPEVFLDGHRFLDKPLGAANTVVLLFSSLTMALAVRASQLDRRKALVCLLAVTVLCAAVFLGVKAVEYKHKWDRRMVPGQARIEAWFSRGPKDVTPGNEFRPDEAYVKGHLEKAGYGNLDKEGLARAVKNLSTFMSIYFCLTALHALHVAVGIGVMVWLLVGAARGRFGKNYFTPVDLAGLYWHLVDLIWIYLFPLLYLIH